MEHVFGGSVLPRLSMRHVTVFGSKSASLLTDIQEIILDDPSGQEKMYTLRVFLDAQQLLMCLSTSLNSSKCALWLG